MKNISNSARRLGTTGLGLAVVLVSLLAAGNLRAEGSKELCANGGDRPWLMYRTDLTDNSPITNLTIISAYANVGETINLGSSVRTTGKIIWFAPDGGIGTNSTTGGVGIISNRTQEVAGPLPNVGGYNPRTVTVTNGQAGVWQIHFVSPNPASANNPTAINATNSWTQPATGGQVAAWDVTVRSSGGTAIPGRVYANLLSMNLGEWLNGGAIRSQVYCLTFDGYQYRINLNSLDPYRFQFFANNRGFRDGTGAPLFKSVDLAGASVKDPLSPDTATDITHKLFFNVPASDMPTNAPIRGGATWMLNPPKTAVTTSGMQFIGLDGTTNQVGSSVGGNFTFNANGPGSYLINIDLDNDGVYTSAVDRVLLGTATNGFNSVFWDGKDGQGNPAPRSVSGFSSAVAVANGEVHFPFADAEGCYSGIVIQRLNGPATNAFTVFWDDSNFASGTKSLPPNGSNSLAGAHSWLPSGNTGFGNQRGIDTWVFVPGNYTQPPSPIIIKQTDLQLVSQTRVPTFVKPNTNVTYTVVITNLGPDNTPQARFLDYFPPGLTNFNLINSVFSGTAGITSSVISNNTYDAQIHMSVGEVGTLTFRGTVSAGLGSGLTNLVQFLTYNDIGDVNDPDRVGAGNNGDTNIVAVTFSVAGFAYSDANVNAARDGGENGTGLASLYAKLINTNSPATAVQAALVDPSTGAYTLTTTTTGGFTVILDDNNTLADVTPNLPTGWLGTEAVGQRRTGVTVNNDVSNLNFGLFNGSYLLLNTIGSPTVLTAAGSITFSVTVTNTSSISNALTTIVNNLANLPANSTYVNGSSAYNGTAIGNPTIVSTTNLTWNGVFSVPANGVGTLTFRANFPATLGIYTNRTFARVSNTQIDSTASTADNAPSIETIRRSAAPNNAPIVSNAVVSVNSGGNVVVNPKATDPDNDPLTIFVVSSPAHGSVAINTNLTFTYTALNNYAGTDSFTYRATDGTSNSVLGTASITVIDATAPVIGTCATNITGTANGSCQAVVPNFTNSVVASDNVGPITITQTPTIGSLAALGTNVVTIYVVDAALNTNTCNTARFIVRDATPPTINTPATNLIASANGSCQAAVPVFTNAVSATDSCSGPVTISQSPTVGTLVGLGTNTITLSVFDTAGNTNTATASFIVRDTTAPTINTCATNQTASASGLGTAAVPNFTNGVVTTEACSAPVTVTQTPALGTLVGLGANTITIRAFDSAGNTNTCTATFTVLDTTPPNIGTCATNQTAEAAASCQASIPNFTAGVIASDNSSNTPVITQSPLAGTLANYGTNNILVIATDGSANAATCTANFVVLDTTPATITQCASNLTVNTDAGTNFASNVNLGPAPTVTDLCGVGTISSNAPATFPLGSNSVIWTVNDIHGNSATCTQSVVVIDNQAPLITCLGDVITNLAPGQCSITNLDLGTPTVADNVGIATIVSNVPALFNIGTTQVVWTVTDTSGNSAVCTQSVTVLDITSPQITQLPTNQTAAAGASCQAAVPDFTGGFSATDDCSTNSVTQSPLAGALAGLGTNTINLIATDASGNASTGTVAFIVADLTPPTINQCATNQTGIAGGGGTAPVPNFTNSVVASDNCGNAFTITQSPTIGTPVGLGVTTITLTVTDAAGNTNSCTATFTVNDTTAPNITTCAGNQTAEAAAGCQALVPDFTAGVVATDNSGVAPVITQSPLAGTLANFGTNAVTLTATDGSSNSAQCTANFIVTDTTAPTITCPASIIVIAPPGTNAVTGVNLGTPVTSDNCGVASVTSNAPSTFFVGLTTVTWTVTDVHGNSNTCQQTVNVSAINHAPVAVADVYTNSENSALSVSLPGLLANDSDPDSDPIFAVLVAPPTNGLVAVNSDGSFVYTPNVNFVGTDSFVYKASDGNLSSSNATISIVVTAVNQPALANPDSFSTPSNTTLNVSAPGVLANDTDPENDPLTAIQTSSPAHGALTLNPNGSFTYIPDSGYIGFDQFSYGASDGTTSSTPVFVTLAVGLGNVPVANPDNYTLNENQSLIVNTTSGVLSNDTSANPLTAFLVSGPQHGTLTFNADGSFSYTPAPNYSGPDSFTYRATDGTLVSGAAIVTLNVTFINQPPVANLDSYGVTTNGSLTVDAASGVLANDFDPEGVPLTAVLGTDVSNGVLGLNPDGSFTYAPTNGFVGTDSFTYTATDGVTSSVPITVAIHVSANNHVPVANNDSYAVDKNGTLTVNAAAGLLANDLDGDGNTLTATLVTGPQHGALTFNTDGSFSYVPTNGFSGADFFTYKANDGTADSGSANVFLTINNVILPPTVQNSTPTVGSSATLIVPAPGALTGAFDPNGLPLTALLVTNVTHGTLTLHGDGSYTYAPAPNFVGVDCFLFAATDGLATSTTASVCITVTDTTPPNITACAPGQSASAGPTCQATLPDLTGNLTVTDNSGTFTVTQNPVATTALGLGTNTITLIAADTAGNSSTCTTTFVVSDTTAPVITLVGANPFTVESPASFSDPGATAADNCAGNLTSSIVVTGAVNVNVVGTYTLRYNVTDPAGNPAVEVTRTVHVVDTTKPVITLLGGNPITVECHGSFSDPGATASDASAGNLTGSIVVTGTVNPNSVGSYTLHYNVSDPSSNAATEVTRTVNVVDTTAPSLTCPGVIIVTAAPGSNSVTGLNLGTPTTADNCGEVTVGNNAPGSFPLGLTVVTWTADDGNGNTNTCQQSVTVLTSSTNHPPVATNGTFEAAADGQIDVPAPGVISFATDPDDDELTAVKVTDPANGTLTLNPNGSFTYIPDPGFTGTDSFTYAVNDGEFQSGPATITLIVTAGGGATDLQLLAGSAAFKHNWKRPNRDRLRIRGKINPRGANDSLAGATMLVTVNGVDLTAPVTLDAKGRAKLIIGGARVSAFLSSKNGRYKFSIGRTNLLAALGLPNVNQTALINLDILLTITGSGLDVPIVGGVFETPYRTKAGKISAARFKFKKHRTLTGVFNSNKTTAKRGKHGGYILKFRGAIERVNSSPLLPADTIHIKIGDHVINVPVSSVNNKTKIPGLKSFRLNQSKHTFRFTTVELTDTGIPQPGAAAPVVHRIPMVIDLPVSGEINVFDTIVELKRKKDTAKKWAR